MRGSPASRAASSIGVTCAAVVALLPLAAPPPATAAPATRSAAVPGSTQSLPLAPLTRDRARDGSATQVGLTRADVRHFSLVGVIWDTPEIPLDGRVQVRTRATPTGRWTGWRDLEAHTDDAPDPATAERASGRVRGATAPLWVGDSDGVDVRVRAGGGRRTSTAAAPLPPGLRLELVDPGEEFGVRSETDHEPRTLSGVELTARQRAEPSIGPRPRIITRRGWGADERLRERGLVYTKRVKAAFVHHTASGNGYRCPQAASVIRGIHRYHVRSMGWRDIGYNFLVDKCGNIYEGRAGGVAKPVLGAHTLGFNTDSMGIAVLGSFGSAKPSKAALDAVARLTAWKLGLWGADPRGRTHLVSGGGNLHRKGKNVRLNVISGHRDGFATQCPGRRLYRELDTIRASAARYQGR